MGATPASRSMSKNFPGVQCLQTPQCVVLKGPDFGSGHQSGLRGQEMRRERRDQVVPVISHDDDGLGAGQGIGHRFAQGPAGRTHPFPKPVTPSTTRTETS